MDQHGDVEGNYTLVSAQTLKNGGIGLLPTGRFFFKLFTAFTAAEFTIQVLPCFSTKRERAGSTSAAAWSRPRETNRMAWGQSAKVVEVVYCLKYKVRPGTAPSVDSKGRLAPGELGFVDQVFC